MRCTSTRVFRTIPANGFIRAGESLVVHLWFMNERFITSTRHYFSVHIIFNEVAVAPLDVFSGNTVRPDGVKRLQVTFTMAPLPDPWVQPAVPPAPIIVVAPPLIPLADDPEEENSGDH
ncbi:hypothetical protein PRIPAC_72364 [Pristionchus pacificus]|uniref:Uncharacterized protein n=1 Tax=Pristionchus pacificus TaxID=54126 RepID=A0A2A6CT04_PRIPA|nr:hypothetical protein PRIPAC_72364 [Pristionchus pacificus]|eukprot:PDM81216.1 hypothetical protein PRIPAC_36219 [Pristionchus pacificus]